MSSVAVLYRARVDPIYIPFFFHRYHSLFKVNTSLSVSSPYIYARALVSFKLSVLTVSNSIQFHSTCACVLCLMMSSARPYFVIRYPPATACGCSQRRTINGLLHSHASCLLSAKKILSTAMWLRNKYPLTKMWPASSKTGLHCNVLSPPRKERP